MADLIQITDEEREQLLLRVVAVTAEYRKIAEAVLPAVMAAAAELHKAFAALQAAGLIDQDGNPARPRPGRPAWQSPYGPPSRRHHP